MFRRDGLRAKNEALQKISERAGIGSDAARNER